MLISFAEDRGTVYFDHRPDVLPHFCPTSTDSLHFARGEICMRIMDWDRNEMLAVVQILLVQKTASKMTGAQGRSVHRTDWYSALVLIVACVEIPSCYNSALLVTDWCIVYKGASWHM
jgi:hypothetical protein